MEKKMIDLSSPKRLAVRFLLAYIFLSSSISLVVGSFDSASEAKCEYEDANLIWLNMPSYSLSDVKAMAWYNGKGNLIASWLEGKGFVEYPPYMSRLIQIGETGIKIRTATRSDSGTYWLSLTLSSVDHKLEAATHLEVKVAPSNQCKPRITQEGRILKAELRLEWCGTPPLTLKWKLTNATVSDEINNSSSLLDLGLNPEPGEYKVCAEGEAAKCFQGNISDLCEIYAISLESLHIRNNLVAMILPIVVVPVLIAIAVIWFARRFIRIKCGCNSKSRSSGEKRTGNDREKAAIGPLMEIQNHLRGLYGRKQRVDVIFSGERYSVDISDVYMDMDFQEMDSTSVRCTDINHTSTPPDNKVISDNKCIIKTQSKPCNPIMIVGDSGSGKSTWCNHFVQCWSRNSKIEDANIEGLNVPDLGKFKFLLYLQLNSSDRGLSFQEILEQSLFQQQPAYLQIIMRCLYDENHAPSILILIDGLDKVGDDIKPITELLDLKLLSLCTVILTSRPSIFRQTFDTRIDSSMQLKLFKVCDMTQEKSKIYIEKVCMSLAGQHKKLFSADDFLMFTKYLHLKHMLKTPYLCLTLLSVWTRKTSFIEITDVLLDIVEHCLRRARTDERVKKNIKDLLQEKSFDVQISVSKLSRWPFLVKHWYLLYELSMIAADIFVSETKRVLDDERILCENLTRRKDTITLRVMYDTGLLTESMSLNSEKNLSNVSFVNVLLYELFVSLAVILKNGHTFDHIVSSEEVFLKNSVIIHMVCQLSEDAGREFFSNIEMLKKGEFESFAINKVFSNPNAKVRYSLTCQDVKMVSQKIFRHEFHHRWMESVLYKGALDDEKLSFLRNYVQYVNNLYSLELENNENVQHLIFWVPWLPFVYQLILKINNCTLLLCKEWNYAKRSSLKRIVIESVSINRSTVGLLAKALRFCENLTILEMNPAVVLTDGSDILSESFDLTNYSWRQLLKNIQDMKKLQSLKLNNLTLVGEVDTFLSGLGRCKILEILELKNLRGTDNSPSLNPTDTSRDNDDNEKPVKQLRLKEINLEQLILLHSPINFLFYITRENKTKIVKNGISTICISAVDMSEESWETLGTHIGALSLSKLILNNVNSRCPVQTFLDGISKCESLQVLSICTMDTAEITPEFTFLKQMKNLSELHLGRMHIAGTFLRILFESINECKHLKILSLRNMDIGDISESLSVVQSLKTLSKVTVDRVTITRGSSSLCDLLNAFSICDSLKTLTLINVFKVDIPSGRKGLKIITK
ncbi:hypothetical protein CHS0354_009665 [Potamilus streckersoni]|uniref:NACHT domain-containing protein n=1 Tax=Potamilus streckersoni TaxID=2493646 RepID=A0AAE0S4D5_9BIVA|nr:hypothetical protein CHS0354_009665 [Potamilus streckersoni]